MGNWVQIDETRVTMAEAGVLPDPIIIGNLTWSYLDADRIEVLIEFVAPTLPGAVIGAHLFVENPDQSSLPRLPANGTVMMDGTKAASGQWITVKAAVANTAVTDEGKFPLSPIAYVMKPPRTETTIRFYLISYTETATNILVRAGENGASPSKTITITPRAYQSGVEYAHLILDPWAEVEYDDTMISSPKYRIHFKWTAPTEAPAVWMKQFGFCTITYQYEDDSRARGPEMTATQTDIRSDWYDLYVGVSVIKCWFVSSDNSESPRENSIITDLTPSVLVTVRWPLESRPAEQPFADNVTNFAVTDQGYSKSEWGVVFKVGWSWTTPVGVAALARWGGSVIYSYIPGQTPIARTGNESETSGTMLFPDLPSKAETWTFRAISQDNNGNQNCRSDNPFPSTPTATLAVTASVVDTDDVADFMVGDPYYEYNGKGTPVMVLLPFFTPPDDPTWANINLYYIVNGEAPTGNPPAPVRHFLGSPRESGVPGACYVNDYPKTSKQWAYFAHAVNVNGKESPTGTRYPVDPAAWRTVGPPQAGPTSQEWCDNVLNAVFTVSNRNDSNGANMNVFKVVYQKPPDVRWGSAELRLYDVTGLIGTAKGSGTELSVDYTSPSSSQTFTARLVSVDVSGTPNSEGALTPTAVFVVGTTAGTLDLGKMLASSGLDIYVVNGKVEVKPAAITEIKLSDGAVSGVKIKDNAISEIKLSDGAVSGVKVQTNAITEIKIAPLSISEIKIQDLAISTIKIAPLAITEAKLGSAAVSEAKLAAGAVTNTKIADGSISSPKITAGAIQAGQIAAGAVTAGTIAAGAIIAGTIAADSITANEIAANAITANELAANSVVAGKIAANSVNTNELVAGSVTANTIAANAVTAGKIAANSVNTNELVAGSVTAGIIAANAVTAGKIAANTISANELQSGSVIADKIGANAITAVKIEAGAIVAGKIAANAVTAGTIAALSITSNELAAGSVIAGKLAANSVTTITIEAGAVTAGTIAANAVTAGKIAANAVTAGTIAAGAIVAGTIAANSIGVNELIAGSVSTAKLDTIGIDIGGGPNKPGVLQVMNAGQQVIAKLGNMGSSYGGWFQVFGAGGADYTTAKVYTDTAGNLTLRDSTFLITYTANAQLNSTIDAGPSVWSPTYTSLGWRVKTTSSVPISGWPSGTGVDECLIISRGMVAFNTAPGYGGYQVVACVRTPTNHQCGEVVVYNSNVLKIHLNGITGICRADGGFQINSAVGVTATVTTGGGGSLTVAGGIITNYVNGSGGGSIGTDPVFNSVTANNTFYLGATAVINSSRALNVTTISCSSITASGNILAQNSSIGCLGFSTWNGAQYISGSSSSFSTASYPNLTFAGGLLTGAAGSDERIKNFVRFQESGLEVVKQLRPLVFKFNALAKELYYVDTEKEHVGFYANKINEFFPDACEQNANGHWAYSSLAITAALVNAVKQIDERLSALEAKLLN